MDEDIERAIGLSLETYIAEESVRTKYADLVVEASSVSSLSPQSPLALPEYAATIAQPGPPKTELPAEYVLGSHIPGQPEIVIAVMGPAGTGKTSFINLVAGKDVGKVGDGLLHGTPEVDCFNFSYGGFNFVLCDTPGFDECQRSDTDILRIISNWLTESYREQRKLTAILYLSRISDPRMQGSPLRNFGMFKELCGGDCFDSVILGTTFWGVIDARQPGLAEQREKELIEDFWKDMVGRGSKVVRIPETRWQARELLVRIARRSGGGSVTLKHQKERLEQGKSFEQTAAIGALNAELERIKAQHEEAARKRRVQMEMEREASKKEQEKKEAAQKAEFERRIEEQRKERMKLEQQRKKQEKELQEQKEASERERKRLEKEQTELAKQLKAMELEHKAKERRQKIMSQIVELKRLMAAFTNAKASNNILANFRDVHPEYTVACDNCFRNIGAGRYYECSKCIDLDPDFKFVLCRPCHLASGVYCFDPSHFSNMEEKEISNGQGSCRRVLTPPSPGKSLPCDRCGNDVGVLYFRKEADFPKSFATSPPSHLILNLSGFLADQISYQTVAFATMTTTTFACRA